jgi:hypothetical protein
MKEGITLEEYSRIYNRFKDKLKPVSTFTDMEGTTPYGNGRPQMITIWGFDADDYLIEQVQTKENRHQEKWDVQCFFYNSPLNSVLL